MELSVHSPPAFEPKMKQTALYRQANKASTTHGQISQLVFEAFMEPLCITSAVNYRQGKRFHSSVFHAFSAGQ